MNKDAYQVMLDAVERAKSFGNFSDADVLVALEFVKQHLLANVTFDD